MRVRQGLPFLVVGVIAVAASGCDDVKPGAHKDAAAVPAAAAPVAAIPASPVTPAATTPMARSIETAEATATPPATSVKAAAGAPATTAPLPVLIRAEVLLDRAHFSPGVIDGKPGENFTNALAAYRKAHGLTDAGDLDGPTLSALTSADKAPVTQTYVISTDDEAGPFIGKLPDGFAAQSKLKTLGYTDPVQELSTKFHMSADLLKSLNPSVDFTKVGTSLVVVQPGAAALSSVARVEVDKTANQVRALDGGGKILAVFPATVGSTERPAPSGELQIVSVAPHPNYTYDPSKLTFGPKSKGKLTLAPGPNNPVGVMWIALNRQSYGIHGTPEPDKVGKTASHGCVRLTNWDAATLGSAVTKGTPVVFLGTETKS